MASNEPFVMIKDNYLADDLLKCPAAIVLLLQVAFRVRKKGWLRDDRLAPGECWVGDRANIGLSDRKYRTAKERLSSVGVARFRRHGRGTIATLLNDDLIVLQHYIQDISDVQNDGQNERLKHSDVQKEGRNERLNISDVRSDVQKEGRNERRNDEKERIIEVEKERITPLEGEVSLILDNFLMNESFRHWDCPDFHEVMESFAVFRKKKNAPLDAVSLVEIFRGHSHRPVDEVIAAVSRTCQLGWGVLVSWSKKNAPAPDVDDDPMGALLADESGCMAI